MSFNPELVALLARYDQGLAQANEGVTVLAKALEDRMTEVGELAAMNELVEGLQQVYDKRYLAGIVAVMLRRIIREDVE